MSTRIIYADIAPGAAEASTVTYSNEDAGRSDVSDIYDGDGVSPITLEQNRWALDGSLTPATICSFWSSARADSAGDFSPVPTISISFSEPVTSQGVTLLFDIEFPTSIRITWDGTDPQTFTPDGPEYFCEHYVEGFSSLTIEVLKGIPGRFARVQQLTIGTIRTFGMDELESVTVVQEQDALTLPFSTLDFNLIPSDATPYVFKQRQPMTVETDHGLVSVFYVDIARREAVRFIVNAVDALGVLDQTEYPGAAHLSGYSAKQWIRDIVAGAFELTFETADITLLGGIVGGTAREALQQVLFACGWACSTDGVSGIRVFDLPTAVSVIPDARTYFGGHLSTELPISKVTIVAHTLYGPTDAGTIEINGELYQDVTQTETKTNPDAVKANEVSVSDCYLISPAMKTAVAQRVYDYYAALSSASVPVVWQGERLGDRMTVTTGWDYLTGNIRKKTLRISNTIKAEVTAR